MRGQPAVKGVNEGPEILPAVTVVNRAAGAEDNFNGLAALMTEFHFRGLVPVNRNHFGVELVGRASADGLQDVGDDFVLSGGHCVGWVSVLLNTTPENFDCN